MKKLIIVAIVICSLVKTQAQQLPVYSMSSENPYSVNPAVAGCLSYNPVILTVRQLWSGIDDAPMMYSLNTHVALNQEMGMGFKAYNMQSGPLSRTGFEGTYSYHIKLAGDGESAKKLSFGLSAFMYQFELDKQKLHVQTPDDPTIVNSSDKIIIPDAAFGMYYYSKNLYVGLSVYQLFNRKVSLLNKESLDMKQVRHYNLQAGYSFDIIEDFYIDASARLRLIEAGIIQGDITAKFVVKRLAWLGVSYRSQDAVSIMVGVGINRFAFGYAYDITLSNIGKHSVGSHELMVVYNLPANSWQRRTFLKGSEKGAPSF